MTIPIIKHNIYINTSVDACFDLARSVEVHTKTTSKTKETAIAGVTKGLLTKGDSVTWEAVHFGIRQRLTARITDMEKPYNFTDVMEKGAFHSFTHIHEFVEEGKGTIMKDTFKYKSPYGIIGKIADKLFLEKYMKNFIESRANELKKIAESK
jgi:ligand-binding SRPBCC domain-containing protein